MGWVVRNMHYFLEICWRLNLVVSHSHWLFNRVTSRWETRVWSCRLRVTLVRQLRDFWSVNMSFYALYPSCWVLIQDRGPCVLYSLIFTWIGAAAIALSRLSIDGEMLCTFWRPQNSLFLWRKIIRYILKHIEWVLTHIQLAYFRRPIFQRRRYLYLFKIFLLHVSYSRLLSYFLIGISQSWSWVQNKHVWLVGA